jgi:hypothetical protein
MKPLSQAGAAICCRGLDSWEPSAGKVAVIPLHGSHNRVQPSVDHIGIVQHNRLAQIAQTSR